MSQSPLRRHVLAPLAFEQLATSADSVAWSGTVRGSSFRPAEVEQTLLRRSSEREPSTETLGFDAREDVRAAVTDARAALTARRPSAAIGVTAWFREPDGTTTTNAPHGRWTDFRPADASDLIGATQQELRDGGAFLGFVADMSSYLSESGAHGWRRAVLDASDLMYLVWLRLVARGFGACPVGGTNREQRSHYSGVTLNSMHVMTLVIMRAPASEDDRDRS